MATMSVDFMGSVNAWVQESERRMLAVFRESTQRTVSLAQSRVPVDTGFCRASIRGSLESMPPINPRGNGSAAQTYNYNPGDIIATIASAQLGQTVYIGYTASYANALEFGHSQQAPEGFVRLAVAQWQHTVDQVTAEAQARVAAR